MNITDDQADELGKLADQADALLYAAKMPLPPALHLEGLNGGLRDIRDKIVKLVVDITGENPWEDNPLEG